MKKIIWHTDDTDLITAGPKKEVRGQKTVGGWQLAAEKSDVRGQRRRINPECLRVAVVACVGRPPCDGTPTTNKNPLVAIKDKKHQLNNCLPFSGCDTGL